MEIPDKIKEFIEQKTELKTLILPQFYPDLKSFEKFQIGYKINGLTGEDLTGEKEGDFKKDWFVICSNYCDDPFFVDFSEEAENYPVYFAFHGCGFWTPIKVTKTIDVFYKHISEIKKIENNREKVLSYLKLNSDLNNEFWKETYAGFYEKDDLEQKEQKEDDWSEWIKGRIIITNLGKDKMKVINALKHQLNLTPQQAIELSKQNEIEFKEGYLVHLKQTVNYLETLGATVIFRED